VSHLKPPENRYETLKDNNALRSLVCRHQLVGNMSEHHIRQTRLGRLMLLVWSGRQRIVAAANSTKHREGVSGDGFGVQTNPSTRTCAHHSNHHIHYRKERNNMPPTGKGAAWSRQKAQQAVEALSAAAGDLTQQASKITELIEYLKTGVPRPVAFGDMLRHTPVLSVLLSLITARMQQQDVRKQELPLFWEVNLGLTQCIGCHVGMSMMQPGFFGSQPSLEQQIISAGGCAEIHS
jgi:hypothetical protein